MSLSLSCATQVREEREQEHIKQGLLNVMDQKLAQVRMDQSERFADETKRMEGTKLRVGLSEALKSFRQQYLQSRKAAVEAVKKDKIIEQARQVAADARVEAGESVRTAAKARAAERSVRDAAYVAKAQANKVRAIDFRKAAKKSKSSMLKEKREVARKEKGNDHLVFEAKAKIFTENRAEAAAVYRSRFASKEEEDAWEASPLRRLYDRTPSSSIVGGFGLSTTSMPVQTPEEQAMSRGRRSSSAGLPGPALAAGLAAQLSAWSPAPAEEAEEGEEGDEIVGEEEEGAPAGEEGEEHLEA